MSLINCPITNVTGYKGSSGATVAVMRGEVDATLKPISSLRKYVKSGDMKFIVTFENKPSLKGVPVPEILVTMSLKSSLYTVLLEPLPGCHQILPKSCLMHSIKQQHQQLFKSGLKNLKNH